MKKFFVISCHVLWRELCYFAATSKNTFNFHFLKQGLHDTPDILREQVQGAIDAVAGNYDAILIGYGLCSNGLVDIQARDTRLVIMRGHDCITFLLGSRDRYQQYFDKNPGTYWYSPGWIDTAPMPGKARLDQLFQEYKDKYGEDNAEYLMQMEQRWIYDYSNAAYVDLGFYDTENYKNFTRKCAEELSWNYDELLGDSKLIVDFLEGNWNKGEFLIVQPGQQIVASHDESIIDAREK